MGLERTTMRKSAIVKAEDIKVEMVKATCSYCYDALPPEIKATIVEVPYKIKSFDDLCEGHQKLFLEPFAEGDRQIAIDTVNTFGAFMNPSARAFLPHVPALVEGKKQRDKDYAATEKSLKEYMADMKKRVDERIAREESAKVEMAIKRGRMEDEQEPTPKEHGGSVIAKRTRKESKTEDKKPKKLSEIADAVQAQMVREGLSPSEIMNRVSFSANENIVSQEPQKKKRGRPAGKSKGT